MKNRAINNPYLTPEELKILLQEDRKSSNLNDLSKAIFAAIQMIVYFKEKIDVLFEYKVDVNVRNEASPYRNTPLHLLIANEMMDFAKYYIAKAMYKNLYIDFNAADSEGKTILIIAAKERKEDFCLYLILLKSKFPNIDLDARDNNGMTALHYACALAQPKLVSELIMAGAKIDIADNKNRYPFDMFDISKQEIKDILSSVSINSHRDVNAKFDTIKDKYGQPLYGIPQNLGAMPSFGLGLLAVKDNVAKFKKIIEQGVIDTLEMSKSMRLVKITSKDDLKYITDQLDNLIEISLLEDIIDKKAQIKTIVEHYLGLGQKIIQATLTGNETDLKQLIENKKQYPHLLDLQDKDTGKTALHIAAEKGQDRICQILVEAGAKSDVKDKEGKTALELAKGSNHHGVQIIMSSSVSKQETYITKP